MLDEVLEYLNPQPGQKFIDCTLGGGTYTTKIAERVGKKGLVVGIDLDESVIANFKKNIALPNVVLFNDSFRNIDEAAASVAPEVEGFDGIVMDLGLSSNQLADEDRGFSFAGSRPLDMAFGPKSPRSTEEIVNQYSAADLEYIFKTYGEERFSRRIAENICLLRKKERILNTEQLTTLVTDSIPKKFWHGRVHPATKIFQALRIETNEELKSLEEALPKAVKLLKPGGRIVVVSFHSLEDRIVKHFFKNREDLKVLFKKVLLPSDAELDNNPRARSAKMRAAEKI